MQLVIKTGHSRCEKCESRGVRGFYNTMQFTLATICGRVVRVFRMLLEDFVLLQPHFLDTSTGSLKWPQPPVSGVVPCAQTLRR